MSWSLKWDEGRARSGGLSAGGGRGGGERGLGGRPTHPHPLEGAVCKDHE